MAERFDLIVRGGEAMTPSGRGRADIGVRAGKVAAIGDLSADQAGEVFDATGLMVLPGVIDTQVHFREPGMEWKEDLETGSRGAVLGGVTAVFEMPNTRPPTTDRARLEDKLARAKGRMHCEHAFYVGATHENAAELGELERMPGCCGVKVFMGASTGDLLIPDDAGIEAVLRSINRRAAFHSEDEARLAERRPLAREGDWTSHPEVRDVEAAVVTCSTCTRLPSRSAMPSSRRVERTAASTSRTSGWLVQSPSRARGRRSARRASSSEWNAARRWMERSTASTPSSSGTSRSPVEAPMNTLTPQQPGRRSSSPRSLAFWCVAPT